MLQVTTKYNTVKGTELYLQVIKPFKMKQTAILILQFFLFTFGAAAQDSASLPRDFIGNWKGKIQWLMAGKSPREFSMQLRIQPGDSIGHYSWAIIYGDEGKDNRPYKLKPVDVANGHWVVDEGDGIILDSYIHGNAIHGAFTVQGSTIIDNYRVENGKMFVEFFSIKLSDKKTSGKGTDETPYVDSYRIASYQVGVLTRID